MWTGLKPPSTYKNNSKKAEILTRPWPNSHNTYQRAVYDCPGLVLPELSDCKVVVYKWFLWIQGFPMDSQRFPRISMDSYGFLGMPMDSYGSAIQGLRMLIFAILQYFNWTLQKLGVTIKLLFISDSYGFKVFLWIPIDSQRFPRISMDSYGFLGMPMDSCRSAIQGLEMLLFATLQ